MTAIPVSVVIVSHGRAQALKRCLMGVSQMVYPSFEIVVVSDQDGQTAMAELPFADMLKMVPFEEANISKARNLGIEAAGGDVVAFIDDDAVPEPTWLSHLIDPFAKADVACTGGYVRGRNGISFQYQARSVDAFGNANAVQMDGDAPIVLKPKPNEAIKTEGTNMAVRRDVLVQMGGFDPAFRFYLDETDMNMRLAKEGLNTAIVPLAQVHHGYLPNAMRRRDRAPVDLYEIGASTAVYLRKHNPKTDMAAALQKLRQNQRKRALEHMVAGRLLPTDVRKLDKSLRHGFAEGQSRSIEAFEPLKAEANFQPFAPTPCRRHLHVGWFWQAKNLVKRAIPGDTIFLFSPSSLFHHHRYVSDGYWQQAGGIYGKSDRSEHLFTVSTRRRRAAQERQRIAKFRLIQDN